MFKQFNLWLNRYEPISGLIIIIIFGIVGMIMCDMCVEVGLTIFGLIVATLIIIIGFLTAIVRLKTNY